MRANIVLEAHALELERMGRPALRGAAGRFRAATVTAIVGPSGAGKSSFLRCLNRLEEPASGRVLLRGENIRSLEPTELRRRVGMIFQTPVIFGGGVRSNLRYGFAGADDDRMAAALGAAGLSADFLDRPSTALSVGQAQRVCIARAIVRDPEALLLDEPTSALDKDASARIEELLGALAERGLAVVLVTHDLAQAKRVATEAVFMSQGRTTEVRSPDDIESVWEAGGS